MRRRIPDKRRARTATSRQSRSWRHWSRDARASKSRQPPDFPMQCAPA